MEEEQVYETPREIVLQIQAFKLLGFSNRKTASQIEEWGFKLTHTTLINHWQRYQKGDKYTYRDNCGREPLLDEKSKKNIQSILVNGWTMAAELARDKKLNKQGVLVDKIERMLRQKHLDAF